MSRDSSVMAVKRAIGGGESFHGRVDAIVENNGKPYTYSDIFASVTYNVGYMQMNVSLDWDDDRKQKSYEISRPTYKETRLVHHQEFSVVVFGNILYMHFHLHNAVFVEMGR